MVQKSPGWAASGNQGDITISRLSSQPARFSSNRSPHAVKCFTMALTTQNGPIQWPALQMMISERPLKKSQPYSSIFTISATRKYHPFPTVLFSIFYHLSGIHETKKAAKLSLGVWGFKDLGIVKRIIFFCFFCSL